MLNFKHRLQRQIMSRIFAINPRLLGDEHALAWTNLGLWCAPQQRYNDAAQHLAQQMGEALALTANDHILDIGCGHGASLQHWHTHFSIKHISAIELQHKCCELILKQDLPYLDQLFEQSLFEAKPLQIEQLYDVILSIDATYHYQLTDYLKAIEAWLAKNGRIGFHFLLKLDDFNQLNMTQQTDIQRQLKWANVQLEQLSDRAEVQTILAAYGYTQIKIVDLTVPVLQGFADYFFARQFTATEKLSLDYLKIKMTAKLCAAIAEHGYIRYVQITAIKQA